MSLPFIYGHAIAIYFSIQILKAQNFPEYWEGKISTFNNGTMENPTPFFIQAAVYDYQTVNNSRGVGLINDMVDIINDPEGTLIPVQYIPSNKPPVNITGTYRKVTFANGLFTTLDVIQRFNYSGKEEVPVQISSSWYDIVEEESSNHVNGYFSDAIKAGTLLNISMEIDYKTLSSSESDDFNKDRKFEIDEYLCYYGGFITELVDNRCFIPYKTMFELYKELWNGKNLRPVALNGQAFVVTNNILHGNVTRDCIDNYNSNDTLFEISPACEYHLRWFKDATYVDPDDVYLRESYVYYALNSQPTGIGLLDNMTYGFNQTEGVTDLNFTVYFSNWTTDFPGGLLDSYRDVSFNYEKFKIVIHYWTADPIPPPERILPSFCIIVAIMLFPSITLALGLILLLITRSSKTMDMINNREIVPKKYRKTNISHEDVEKQKIRSIREYEEKQMMNNYMREYENQPNNPDIKNYFNKAYRDDFNN